MSSSKDSLQQQSATPENNIGVIFLGPGPDQETTLEKLRTAKLNEGWTHQTEKEYLERIKNRATEKVKELLLHARERADEIKAEARAEVLAQAEAAHAESERILAEARRTLVEAEHTLAEAQADRQAAANERQQATEQGFAVGQAEAMKRLAETRAALGEVTAVVLFGIQKQCQQIFEVWRQDLAALLREAVEKATGLVISTERAAMLDVLLEQSAHALLDRQEFTVKVNPGDAELVTGILADTTRAGTRISNWELRVDPALEPGSLVVESAAALIDNSRGARRSVVDEVLENLSLPRTQADLDCAGNVAGELLRGLEANGFRLNEEMAAEPEVLVKPLQNAPQSADLGPDIIGQDITDQDITGPDAPIENPNGYSLGDSLGDLPGDSLGDLSSEQPAGQDADQTYGSPAPEILEMVDPVENAADQITTGASSEPITDLPVESLPESLPEVFTDALTPSNPQTSQTETVEAETTGLIDEFLGDLSSLAAETGPDPLIAPDAEDGGLPPGVADDLLAEMGFGTK